MESKFNGGVLGLIGINLLSGLIVFCTFGIATPWAVCIKQRWLMKHTQISGQQLEFVGHGIDLFGRWLLWLFLTFITLGIYTFWLRINLIKWITKNTKMIG